jgi:hypothetical protein
MGLEHTHQFFQRGHSFPLDHPPRRLRDYLADQRDDVVQNDRQFLASLGRLGLEPCANLLGLPHGRPRDVEHVLIGGLHPVGCLRAALPRRLHDPFHLALGTARAIPQDRARQGRNHLEHLRCFDQRPAEHPHATVEQGAVGGVMDISFHDRPIDTPLAATRDLERPRQHDDVIEQVVQGRRLEQVGPAEQGRIIRHGLRIDATELAQDQAIADPALGSLIAPPI